jgi:hypothetical protein
MTALRGSCLAHLPLEAVQCAILIGGAEVTLAQQLRSTKFEGRPEHAVEKNTSCYCRIWHLSSNRKSGRFGARGCLYICAWILACEC